LLEGDNQIRFGSAKGQDDAEHGFVRRRRTDFAGSAGYSGGTDQDRVQQP
jgi:hypothetical protein